MTTYKNRLSAVILMLIFILAAGCTQVEQIPGQVGEDLPNPVSEFTEKDRFKIGLKWYQQGNFDIAKKFWKPLAESGDCDSEYAMGLLYYSGAGVRRNYSAALMLWTKAGNKGQAQAQIALGTAYSRLYIPSLSINCKSGCGVEMDLPSAYKWFSLAAEMGSQREVRASKKSIQKIAKKLSPWQIEKIDIEIDNWESSPSKCESRGILIAAPGATSAFY